MIPKLRAWGKVEKEWLEIKLLGFWENNELWYLEIESGELLFEDDLGVKWELSQSTGFKDKNGVEIFEGDVVKDCHDFNFEVVSSPAGTWNIVNGKDRKILALWAFEVEVIGNKHEHPNLLEE